MSRPVCQVIDCERPATCFVDTPLLGGFMARLRVCEEDAQEQASRAQDIYLDVTLQMQRKRT